MQKAWLFFLSFLLSGILLAESPVSKQPVSPQNTAYFTPEELSKYNGRNSQPAYIAVDGIIYDVTGTPAWLNGTHKGFSAGQDVTEFIKKAPHGTQVLQDKPVVGKLVKGIPAKELSKYNGKNGQPAYIAVDGLVYDVTNDGAWKKGSHKGISAGQDISEFIKKAPHGTKVLQNKPVIGKLVK